MATFEATRSQFTQQHFEVLEVDLPVVNGTCTFASGNGFGTPLTCDETWASTYKTYKFTNQNAPLLAEPVVYRAITSIRENPTEVKPGNGLSAKGTLTITFTDFIGDPNTETAGVTAAVIKQGTFFGKLNARQIMENKAVRLKLYRVEEDGTIDLVNGAETHYYRVESFKSNSNGTWSLMCKDILSLSNLDEKTWPPTSGGFLRLDVDAAVTVIPVDAVVDYSAAFAVRIGDEFFEVTSVTDNQGAAAALNVIARGSNIVATVSGEILTRTFAGTHTAGDEVFICDISDNEEIDDLLTRILVASDFDVALIPAAAWAAEVAEWHATDKVNTIHSESEDVNDVLQRILIGYLMDLWFDQIDNEAKLSAISVWKQSAATLTEGREIDAYTVKDEAVDDLRASRALVIYNKTFKANDDSVSSYAQGSQNSDNQIISAALYEEHKDKLFDNNFVIDEDAAELLVQRYVSRFKFTPFIYSWTTQERFLTFKTGDVVDLNSVSIQSPSGLPSGNLRSQITKITPKYTKDGRTYDVKAMSYDAAFNDNSEIVIDSPLGDANLYILAGAPSTAVTLTFIFDGSYSQGENAIIAGAFPTGSKLILILANGFDGQAKGGDGGTGNPSTATAGEAGGVVYDAQGVDTDIYFSGATPSTAYPTADGYIRAPGGGGGGTDGDPTDPFLQGNAGGGGAGRNPGIGGSVGGTNGNTIGGGGAGADNGDVTPLGGNGGAWGVAGGNAAESGGAAGSGVIDSGATVTFFGSNATRYINGNGDH